MSLESFYCKTEQRKTVGVIAKLVDSLLNKLRDITEILGKNNNKK